MRRYTELPLACSLERTPAATGTMRLRDGVKGYIRVDVIGQASDLSFSVQLHHPIKDRDLELSFGPLVRWELLQQVQEFPRRWKKVGTWVATGVTPNEAYLQVALDGAIDIDLQRVDDTRARFWLYVHGLKCIELSALVELDELQRYLELPPAFRRAA